MDANDARHVPVMRDRILDLLTPALTGDDACYLDCTLGLGGHAAAVAERFPEVRVIGIDRDPAAIAIARQRLARFGDRCEAVHAIYHELPDVLAERRIERVAAIVMDLGLSSLQIDDADRGFAYASDAPLDMRMNPTAGPSARDFVNGSDEAELARILHEWGEERFSRRIAAAIVAARDTAPIETSAQLVEIIVGAMPARVRHGSGGHPAKRSFQALRIAVNRELESLDAALPAALAALRVGGRMAVLAYHSGEDRRVKRAFAAASASTAPAGLAVVPDEHQPRFELITRGAERPSEAEVAENPRAASARLRVAECRQEVAA